MMNIQPRNVLIAVLGLCWTLTGMSGCSGGFFETKMVPPTVYVLHAAASDPAKQTIMADLAVSIPVPAPGLDTERIATLHDTHRLDYFRDAQWGATTPNVVQALICETLSHSGFHSVAPEQARLNATHLIDLQLVSFHAEYADEHAAPIIQVALTASVLRLKDRKLMASFPLKASVKAAQNNMGSVVNAYEAATQQVAAALSVEVQKIVIQ
jgi:ABC-type uncharacterized transport system auxiliary subunit